jgi:hypothetical protein
MVLIAVASLFTGGDSWAPVSSVEGAAAIAGKLDSVTRPVTSNTRASGIKIAFCKRMRSLPKSGKV